MRIKALLSLLLLCCGYSFLFAQSTLWSDTPAVSLRSGTEERWIEPQKYRLVQLDIQAFETLLAQTPERFNPQNENAVLTIPMPDGSFQQFAITQSSLFEPGLARKFPDIKTFAGQGIDDPSAAIYLDWTPKGFHAMILSPGKMVFIDPFLKNDNHYYVSYDKRDFKAEKSQDFTCGTEKEAYLPSGQMSPVLNDRNATVSLRTYRLAMAATGEYTAFHGGTKTDAMAAITTTVNRISGIYETELAIRFVLVSNNDLIVYTNAVSDPYSNPPLLTENQANVDAVIGTGNYDIGHVIGRVAIGNTGGSASIASVCVASSKARGRTATPEPKGDPFDIDFAAHEIGHQFGANHTFNGNQNFCSGTSRNALTAYEPGSGSTIMAYAGICSTNNIQFNTHAYFHKISLDEITAYVTTGSGSTCPAVTATGNNSPSVNADPLGMNGKSIPTGTPFELTASGSDPDGHSLTYTWEQWNLGDAGAPSSSRINGPVFRSLPPSANPVRSFPCLSNILENTSGPGEYLPSVGRSLNFKCTVRDHAAGGGATASGDLALTVTNMAGPFYIHSHNTSSTVNGTITILWNVANTTSAPVNCTSVDILLSTDGGHTFTALLSGTPNDGSQAVTLPNVATGQARIKVKCSDNVFFDINNADLRIAPAGSTCNELFLDGDMEALNGDWDESTTNLGYLIDAWGTAHSGTVSAWLGYENDEVSQLSQTVTIPSDAQFANLEFWYKIERFDCGGDALRVKVNGAIISSHNLCNDPGVAGWTRQLVDLSDYKGSSPEVMIEVVNDSKNPSDVFIDDVSLFICKGAAFPLPVELLEFTVQPSGKDALLNWTTLSESNNEGFEIEMRRENTDFQPVAFVKGAGTTNERQNYLHVVPNLQPGIYYFRLRQMDTDGSANVSPVRTLTLAGETYVSVQPNPAGEMANFVLLLDAESELKLEVLDLMGRVIHTVTEGVYASGKFQLGWNTEGLSSGIYFYRLTSGNNKETGRFSVMK